ncbi:MAG: hypothetical protein H7A53_09625 [Akkermansiaceae bacterium]|nr:hypothetical protein [Akkermansiaceae bacterium]MCP5551137.1 hypothetical protein [Akkermansiaceae bacterium]
MRVIRRHPEKKPDGKPTAGARVLRGASWNNNNPDNLLSSNRNNNTAVNYPAALRHDLRKSKASP